MAAGAQSLMPVERVRRRPEFERAYNTGVKVNGRYMTLFVVANGTGTPRLGVAATRKLGSAVVRNRAKRLSRELYRRQKLAAGVDVIIVPRREMLDASFATLESDYAGALTRRAHHRAGPRSPNSGPRRPRNPPRV